MAVPRLEAYRSQDGNLAAPQASAGVHQLLDLRLEGGLEDLVGEVKTLAAAAEKHKDEPEEQQKHIEALLEALTKIVDASADEDCAEEIGFLGGHALATRLLERCAMWDDCRAVDLVADWTSVTLTTLGKLMREAPVGALDDRPRPFVVHLANDTEVILREVRDDHSEAAHGDKANVRVGYKLWGGAVVLATALLEMGAKGSLEGKRVLELGAGLGLCGLAAGRSDFGAAAVVLTDFHPRIVSNLAYNIAVNDLETPRCSAQVLDWEDLDAAFEDEVDDKFDLIIGSDIVCQALDCELVGRVLTRLLRPNGAGVALVTLGSADSRFGVEAFAPAMKAAGLECRETILPVPDVCLPASEGSQARGEVFLGTARAYVSFEITTATRLEAS
ncbi:Hypothetical Protein FCC1311_057802 [Hondaea fermentalgiana]|uniref:Protein N-lysine methyltransferase METTL21A n=1 Tax=Hondaea fermentalgiana TaxID=2315210 RepID=A0A2R5GGU4_9STRA|nr:Hypothetical Protein FCC1311_057802 [Hondaea fermentalgiana]|eukprot:GBG29559.1 Hypothetical Protein FCC1311_057802 [Hondaea fermentalgiana]